MNNMTRTIAIVAALCLAMSVAAQQPKSKSASPAQKPGMASAPAAAPNSGPGGTGIPSSWNKVPIPALHEFKPQEPRRVEFSNGLVVFFQEDHELPVINGFI